MTDYLDFAEAPAAAVNGLAAVVRARGAALAQVALNPGLFVTTGTLDGAAALPDAAGDVTESGLGIVEYVRDKPDYSSSYHIGSGEMFRFVQQGRIWVTVEDAVADGQTAFVRITAKNTPGATEAVGRLRSDADGADSGVATECTRIIFRTTQATPGGLALVEINLP
jgi:hypothetical protein